MPYYEWTKPPPPPPMHGPQCDCDVCRGQRVMNQERLSSTDRLAWLEKNVIELKTEIEKIRKGQNNMGVALWCQPGSHAFDGNDQGAKRITTDRDLPNGQTEEITVHVCSRHAEDLFKPRPKSLETLRQEIEEATSIE